MDYYLFLLFVMLSRLFIAALWSPAGKRLTSLPSIVMFNCVFVTFLWDILGQVWYLIVSIPDLCRLSYFNFRGISQNGEITLFIMLQSRNCNIANIHFSSIRKKVFSRIFPNLLYRCFTRTVKALICLYSGRTHLLTGFKHRHIMPVDYSCYAFTSFHRTDINLLAYVIIYIYSNKKEQSDFHVLFHFPTQEWCAWKLAACVFKLSLGNCT